jgi:hypothetical protein
MHRNRGTLGICCVGGAASHTVSYGVLVSRERDQLSDNPCAAGPTNRLMLVALRVSQTVELWFPTGQAGFDRASFWTTFEMHRLGKANPSDVPLSTIDSYEEQFRSRFPIYLQQHLNGEMNRVVESSRGTIPPWAPNLRLVAIQYGSIRAILDIMGVESSNLRDLSWP